MSLKERIDAGDPSARRGYSLDEDLFNDAVEGAALNFVVD